MSCAPANRLPPRLGRACSHGGAGPPPRLLLSLAYAGYSGRDLALTWTAASGHEDQLRRPG
jgi:hypothetical protein